MRSNREVLIDGLESIEAGCRTVAAYPLETLSRSEGLALLDRLDKLDQQLARLHKRMSGRLLVMAPDHRASA